HHARPVAGTLTRAGGRAAHVDVARRRETIGRIIELIEHEVVANDKPSCAAERNDGRALGVPGRPARRVLWAAAAHPSGLSLITLATVYTHTGADIEPAYPTDIADKEDLGPVRPSPAKRDVALATKVDRASQVVVPRVKHHDLAARTTLNRTVDLACGGAWVERRTDRRAVGYTAGNTGITPVDSPRRA